MNDKLKKVRTLLAKYNQEHLLKFYYELSDTQKNILLNQILEIDFKQVISVYNNSLINRTVPFKDVTPIPHFEKDELSSSETQYYTNIGETELKQHSFAVITMAGGQGSRLGYKGPKGTYELHLSSGKKSLFEILCCDIKKANEKYNICIPWYIMTSIENNKATIEYFENNNYFDYPKDNIKFFIQSELPIIDINGKLILQEPYLVKEASCGNGNVFNSLVKDNILSELESNGIKWLAFGGIDNILLKNIDPLFLGLTINGNFEIASKSIFKKTPMEKTAVYCKKDGHPSMFYYDDIDLKTSIKKDENGKYLYREANMLSHIMSLNAVKKVTKINLPLHRTFKRNAFVNDEKMKQIPDTPNTFKFENFIFDSFMYFDDMLLLRVNEEEEFAPIKSFTGTYNPDTAIEKYESYWNLSKKEQKRTFLNFTLFLAF